MTCIFAYKGNLKPLSFVAKSPVCTKKKICENITRNYAEGVVETTGFYSIRALIIAREDHTVFSLLENSVGLIENSCRIDVDGVPNCMK